MLERRFSQPGRPAVGGNGELRGGVCDTGVVLPSLREKDGRQERSVEAELRKSCQKTLLSSRYSRRDGAAWRCLWGDREMRWGQSREREQETRDGAAA